MPSGQLPTSPAGPSLYDASPHTIVGSPHLRSENLRSAMQKDFLDSFGHFRTHAPQQGII
jgi:hypothetical protein